MPDFRLAASNTLTSRFTRRSSRLSRTGLSHATEAVKPPQVRREEMRPLTAEQVRILFDAAKGDRLEALYILAVTTGLRQGELLGLKWDDIYLRAGLCR